MLYDPLMIVAAWVAAETLENTFQVIGKGIVFQDRYKHNAFTPLHARMSTLYSHRMYNLQPILNVANVQ